MEAKIDQYCCPLCKIELNYNPRYPRYVCAECAAKAVSADNRPLSFFNLSLSGGYGVRYADTQEIYDTHLCFIEGTKCWADEALFGGIVIESLSLKDLKD